MSGAAAGLVRQPSSRTVEKAGPARTAVTKGSPVNHSSPRSGSGSMLAKAKADANRAPGRREADRQPAVARSSSRSKLEVQRLTTQDRTSTETEQQRPAAEKQSRPVAGRGNGGSVNVATARPLSPDSFAQIRPLSPSRGTSPQPLSPTRVISPDGRVVSPGRAGGREYSGSTSASPMCRSLSGAASDPRYGTPVRQRARLIAGAATPDTGMLPPMLWGGSHSFGSLATVGSANPLAAESLRSAHAARAASPPPVARVSASDVWRPEPENVLRPSSGSFQQVRAAAPAVSVSTTGAAPGGCGAVVQHGLVVPQGIALRMAVPYSEALPTSPAPSHRAVQGGSYGAPSSHRLGSSGSPQMGYSLERPAGVGFAAPATTFVLGRRQ